jgi:hypothetical protein
LHAVLALDIAAGAVRAEGAEEGVAGPELQIMEQILHDNGQRVAKEGNIVRPARPATRQPKRRGCTASSTRATCKKPANWPKTKSDACIPDKPRWNGGFGEIKPREQDLHEHEGHGHSGGGRRVGYDDPCRKKSVSAQACVAITASSITPNMRPADELQMTTTTTARTQGRVRRCRNAERACVHARAKKKVSTLPIVSGDG